MVEKHLYRFHFIVLNFSLRRQMLYKSPTKLCIIRPIIDQMCDNVLPHVLNFLMFHPK